MRKLCNWSMMPINRAKTLVIFRELCEFHRNVVAYAQIVEIVESGNPDEFKLKIKASLDTHNKEVIDKFLKERNLKMKKEDEYITIYEN